jgi:hypothetical protein
LGDAVETRNYSRIAAIIDKVNRFKPSISRILSGPGAVAMFDYTKFHDVFPTETQLPYDRKLQHDIEAHRKNVDGVLFIDRVLRALGITKGKSLTMRGSSSSVRGALLADPCFLDSQSIPPQDRECASTIAPADLRIRNVDAP